MGISHQQSRRALLISRALVTVLSSLLCAAGASALIESSLVQTQTPLLAQPRTPRDLDDAAPPRVESAPLIFARNLFSRQQPTPSAPPTLPPRHTPDASRVDPEQQPDASTSSAPPLNLTLVGTMVSDHPRLSIAHVNDTLSRHAHIVRPGDLINDTLVMHVERHRLWLRRDRGRGDLTTLRLGLPGEHPPSPGPSHDANDHAGDDAGDDPQTIVQKQGNVTIYSGRRPSSDDPPALPRGAVRRLAAGRYRVDPDQARLHLDQLTDLRRIHALQLATSDGDIVGVRVGRAQKTSLLGNIGLQNNDLIISVDGTPTRDPRAALDFLDHLQRDGRATLVIDRRGRRQTLVLTTD